MSRLAANCLLCCAALVWGMAFIAQKTGMETIGPMGFTFSRYLMGALFILPLALFESRRTSFRRHIADRPRLGVGAVAPESFMGHFTVFVLAIFVGWQVIWNVTPALHTPLMSVTNAISGIIVIGALVQMDSTSSMVLILAAVALFVASINIFGGFWVTQRMLRMFRKDL
ncbi:MAG: hypothetical protein EBZ14_10930 [Gammaproteobacteria bacterium]|nr:hypothetical protein [Gammaproteobacteria bacterium]